MNRQIMRLLNVLTENYNYKVRIIGEQISILNFDNIADAPKSVTKIITKKYTLQKMGNEYQLTYYNEEELRNYTISYDTKIKTYHFDLENVCHNKKIKVRIKTKLKEAIEKIKRLSEYSDADNDYMKIMCELVMRNKMDFIVHGCNKKVNLIPRFAFNLKFKLPNNELYIIDKDHVKIIVFSGNVEYILKYPRHSEAGLDFMPMSISDNRIPKRLTQQEIETLTSKCEYIDGLFDKYIDMEIRKPKMRD